MKEYRSGGWSPGLGEPEQETLVSIAEASVQWAVRPGETEFDFERFEVTPRLRHTAATFVTLLAQGRLRGCIGCLQPTDPLFRSVHENAVNAALHDSRFRPLSARELSGIEIKVSVLSPIREIPSVDALVIGEQGIILEKGASRAVYLPEVAKEQGWDREQTLSSLSAKAGLARDAWRTGCRFSVFESVVYTR